MIAKLADHLFDPVHQDENDFDLEEEPWHDQAILMDAVVPGETMAPQPTMNEYYQDPDMDLTPTYADFDDEDEDMDTVERYSTDNHPPGYVGVLTAGWDQTGRLKQAGLDPAHNPDYEELVRLANHEARVQQQRKKISKRTIDKECAKAKNRRVKEAFPAWKPKSFEPVMEGKKQGGQGSKVKTAGQQHKDGRDKNAKADATYFPWSQLNYAS